MFLYWFQWQKRNNFRSNLPFLVCDSQTEIFERRQNKIKIPPREPSGKFRQVENRQDISFRILDSGFRTISAKTFNDWLSLHGNRHNLSDQNGIVYALLIMSILHCISLFCHMSSLMSLCEPDCKAGQDNKYTH